MPCSCDQPQPMPQGGGQYACAVCLKACPPPADVAVDAAAAGPQGFARVATYRAPRSVLRACSVCKRYTMQAVCPHCGNRAVAPGAARGAGSISAQIRALHPGMPSHRSLLAAAMQPAALIPVAPRAAGRGYALVHTIGRHRVDPFGGDGAYANWMQAHFSNQTDPDGCVSVHQLVHTGAVGNYKRKDLERDFNPDILRQFQAVLDDPRVVLGARTVILNWHIRWTNGTPNGQTGHGLNPPLVEAMRRMARDAGKRFAMVYTIHEYTEASDYSAMLPSPSSVIGLNGQIVPLLRRNFGGLTHASVVPGLMTSMHTAEVDDIMRYVPRDAASWPETLRMLVPQLSAMNLTDIVAQYVPMEAGFDRAQFGAALLQRLRLHSLATRFAAPPPAGIAVFGMTMDRHAMPASAEDRSTKLSANLDLLCAALDAAGVDRALRVVLAGKPPKPGSVTDRELTELCRAHPHRLLRLGLIGRIDELAGCKYAISFDPAGFRENASAMINLIRNGQMLFSCDNERFALEFIRRAVAEIQRCEAHADHYERQMTLQHARYEAHEPAHVGRQLDQHLRQVSLAGGGPAPALPAAAADGGAVGTDAAAMLE